MRGFKKSLEADIALEEWLVKKIKSELRYLPKGNLKLGKNGKNVYYKPTGGKPRYEVKNSRTAKGIARRHFLEKQLEIIETNLKNQKPLTGKYQSYRYEAVIEKISKVYRIVDMLARQEVERIPAEETETSGRFSEGRKHRLRNHETRRSKSEIILSMLYEGYGIPYSYEELVFWPSDAPPKAQKLKEELNLPDYVVPDFSFTFPDGRKKYHEHLGMMDNAEYMEKWKKKMMVYFWAGITPGDNLIITADDRNGCINQEEIAKLIEGLLADLMGTAKRT